jgi:hypothetical protein
MCSRIAFGINKKHESCTCFGPESYTQSDQKFEKKLPNFRKCSQNCIQITKAKIESQK